MPRLAVRAELIKLARILNTEPETLDFLDEHDAQALRSLREGLSDALFKRHASSFKLLASLSGLLPAGVIAKIAQHALGAFLAGRVTGEMEPDRAVAIAGKLPTDFLAEVSLSIDPARAQNVIAAMPTRTVEAVAQALVQRGEYITMGRFVGAISERALFRVVEQLDAADLLHTGFYVEDSSRLDSIIDSLADARLKKIVQTATEEDLWPEALSLVTMVGDEQKGRLGNLVAEEDEAVLDSLVLVAQAQGLWAEVLVAAAAMTDANQQRVATLPSLSQPQVLEAIIDTAHQQDMWSSLLPLLTKMTAEARSQAVNTALEQDDSQLKKLLKTLSGSENLSQTVDMLRALPEPQQQTLLQKADKLLSKADRARLDKALSRA